MPGVRYPVLLEYHDKLVKARRKVFQLRQSLKKFMSAVEKDLAGGHDHRFASIASCSLEWRIRNTGVHCVAPVSRLLIYGIIKAGGAGVGAFSLTSLR